MRATDIIRNVLDMIDAINRRPQAAVVIATQPQDETSLDDESRRFEQIQDLQTPEPQGFANQPQERVSDVSAVTTAAGGGMNGPKHPADLRVKDASAYVNIGRGER